MTGIHTATQMPTRNIKELLNKALSALPSYVPIRWAAIVETNAKGVVSTYPKDLHPAYLRKSLIVFENSLQQKDDFPDKSKNWIKNLKDSTLVYSDIENYYTLIVNLPSDIPITPVKTFFEHAKLILEEIVKTH